MSSKKENQESTTAQQSTELARKLVAKSRLREALQRVQNQDGQKYLPEKSDISQPLVSHPQPILGQLYGTALESTAGYDDYNQAGQIEREIREGTARTTFDDREIQEVEYRRVQLEKTYLIGIYQQDYVSAKISLTELAALVDTAGAQVVGSALQKRLTPDPATFIGRGKAQEIALEIGYLGADTVIVNASLQPSQRRGLEDVLKVKVIDRTAVILDIFAQHAQSREGKAQVELAQLEYLLPRLRGWGDSMSRQAGGRVAGGAGIGSRGPGETKIELDRRRIGQRMAKLRRQIANMKKARDTKRQYRKNQEVPTVAIVGYTNAGKSSLLNVLTQAQVMVQNALFATLDPTVRKAKTSEGRIYTLSDTVGFISDLPHELVEAFRSTLEEVAEADLLLHLVDGAHANPISQINAVNQVLREVDEELAKIPQIIVFNKADLLTDIKLTTLKAKYPQAIFISALKNQGITELKAHIENLLPAGEARIDAVLPFSRSDLISKIHTQGQVEKIDYLPEGTHIIGTASARLAREIFNAQLLEES